VEQVLLVKEDDVNDLKPMDVVNAAASLIGEAVTYNQGYCGIKTKKKMNLQCDNKSFQYIIPYLSYFQE
jgi:hypothetical protein